MRIGSELVLTLTQFLPLMQPNYGGVAHGTPSTGHAVSGQPVHKGFAHHLGKIPGPLPGHDFQQLFFLITDPDRNNVGS